MWNVDVPYNFRCLLHFGAGYKHDYCIPIFSPCILKGLQWVLFSWPESTLLWKAKGDKQAAFLMELFHCYRTLCITYILQDWWCRYWLVQFCSSQLRLYYFGTTWIIFLTRLKSVWKLVSFKEWCLENSLCAKYASSKRMDIWGERRNRNIQYHTPTTNCTSQAAMCLYAQRISDCCICSVRQYLLFLKIIP